jgi:hypothetical protein
MPTLVTSYFSESIKTGDTTSLTTPSFSPAIGEVIVIKATTWDTTITSGTPSGGSLTYTRQATAQPGGFNCYATIFTTVVASSPGSMSITLSPPSASSYHTMVVERWANAKLAATPATNAVISGSLGGTGVDTPTATITTTGSNSIITWVNADNQSNDPASRAYLSGAIQDGLGDGHLGSSSVHYYAYQTAATVGNQTIGMTLPTGQKWTMTGIEVLDAPLVATVWLFRA